MRNGLPLRPWEGVNPDAPLAGPGGDESVPGNGMRPQQLCRACWERTYLSSDKAEVTSGPHTLLPLFLV